MKLKAIEVDHYLGARDPVIFRGYPPKGKKPVDRLSPGFLQFNVTFSRSAQGKVYEKIEVLIQDFLLHLDANIIEEFANFLYNSGPQLSDEKTNRTHLTCKEMGVILIIITTLLIAHIKYEYFILYAI